MGIKLNQKTRIGIFALLALLLVYIGINYLKGINLFKRDNLYYVVFEEVHNVKRASPVLIDGYKVGIVKDIEFDFEKGHGIKVELDIDSKMKLERGTQATINQTALSGAEIHLLCPAGRKSGEYLNSGDFLPAAQSTGDLLAMANTKIMPAIVDLLPKADSLLTSLTNLANSSEFGTILRSLERSAKELNKSMIEINQIVRRDFDPMMSNLSHTAANAKEITESINKVDMAKLDKVLSNLNDLTGELKATTEQLRKQDNTAGRLLTEDQLYQRVDSLVNSAEMLMRDIRQNPKRYVHFSLF